jgi:broad specificity phosphatase PhoE
MEPGLPATPPHPIWLARHLPSAHASAGRITSTEFGTWSLEYDEAGLADGATANRELVELAARCTVLSSPLRRAIETAALAGSADPLLMPVLARAIRPDVPLRFVRLRPKTWRGLTRVVWRFGWAPTIETQAQARERAAIAAEKLAVLAVESELLVIGHNYFNTLIGTALRRRGWCGPRRPVTRHGRANAYLPPALRTAPWRPSTPAERLAATG